MMTLTPAYGRDYKSKAAVMEDWNANRNFQIQPSGKYINREQVDAEGIKVMIRYGKLRRVVVL